MDRGYQCLRWYLDPSCGKGQPCASRNHSKIGGRLGTYESVIYEPERYCKDISVWNERATLTLENAPCTSYLALPLSTPVCYRRGFWLLSISLTSSHVTEWTIELLNDSYISGGLILYLVMSDRQRFGSRLKPIAGCYEVRVWFSIDIAYIL